MQEYSVENRDVLAIRPRRVCLSYNFSSCRRGEAAVGVGVCGRGRWRRALTEPVWRAGSLALSNIQIISMLEIFINGVC